MITWNVVERVLSDDVTVRVTGLLKSKTDELLAGVPLNVALTWLARGLRVNSKFLLVC